MIFLDKKAKQRQINYCNLSLTSLFGGTGGLFLPFLLGIVYNRFGLFVTMDVKSKGVKSGR